MNILIILLVFGGLCAAYGVLLKRVALRGLTCTRAFSRREVFEGEEAELVEVISNDRPLIVPWLRVESRISRHLQFGRQENLDVSGSMYHKSLFTLMPYQRITRRHRVKFLHRGEYNIGSASLTAGDVTGFFQCNRSQKLDVPVTVFPRLLDERELPMPISRLIGEMTVERQLQQDPFLIRGIRPYQPGDPVRDIHWPATARMGETHVRVHDFTAQTRLMVVINSQMKEHQWDNLMEYEQDLIEYEISLAATLCVRALRAGLTAGFACNMPLGESEESTVILPAGGEARDEELLASLARIRILRTRTFNTFLEELSSMVSGVDMIVLSPYDSDELQLRLEALRLRGNTVRLYVPEGGAA